jgi:CrcB protein
MRVLLVGAGGFAGSVLRYWLSGVVQSGAGSTSFPVGTLVVNVLGCCAIGVLSELSETRGLLSPDSRALLIVGLLGGFTTFSAFANETVSAVRDGDVALASLNVLASVALCLGGVWLGRGLANAIWR